MQEKSGGSGRPFPDGKPVAVVTGAGSGIGREIALALSRRGYAIVAAGRSRERLTALAERLETPCDLYFCDLADRLQVRALAEYVLEIRPEIVVNNAGFGVFGDVWDAPAERQAAMIDVNVTALHILTHAALNAMRERGTGRILNVGSSAGLLPGGPHMAGYYATKAYVVSLTGAIAEELREAGSRVTVSVLCPGPVDTDFNRVAGVRFALRGIDAARCAEAAVSGMLAGKTFIVPEARIRAAAFGARLVPRKLAMRLISGQQKKKEGPREAKGESHGH